MFLGTKHKVIEKFSKTRCFKSILLIALIIGGNIQVSLGLTPTSVFVKSIAFNYDGSSYANDALTVRNADGSTAIIPEMEYYVRSNKVAYIKGQTNRTIGVSFQTNCPNSNLVITIETNSGEGIGVVSNYTITNYTPRAWVYIPLNGTIPNNISEHYCQLKFSITLTPIAPGYGSCTGLHYYGFNYYTTYAAPVAPMNEPWLSVLDYACDWAAGRWAETDIV